MLTRLASLSSRLAGQFRSRQERSPLRALIVDPALHAMGGHHYTATERLIGELKRLDIGCEAVGSAYADRRVQERLGVTPCFERSLYGRRDWTTRGFEEQADETHGALARYLRAARHKPDLVVLPCCDQVLAAALASCLRALPSWRPRILLWLLFPPVAHPQNASASSDAPPQSTAEEYRRAFAALKAVLADPRKLMVYCETETLAATYRAILGVDVSIGDGPNLAPPERDLPRRPRPGPTTIVCVGYANEAKGYNLLPNAIRQVVQARPDVRFMIHGSRSQLDANQDFSTFEALGHIGPQVVVNSRVLEDDEYLAWLDQADLLLLPYDPETYRSRGSGVFAEATSLGIPSIVTAGCAFASQAFAEQRAVAIERHDSDGVARAILRAIGGLPALAEKAEAAALASSQGTTGRYCAREALELLSNRIRNELTSPDRQ